MLDEVDGWTTFERTFRAGVNFARAVADEVRLHLARGLDHVWKTSCVKDGHCHHELGWWIATETMRFCVLGAWDPETGRRSVLPLEEPITESLAGVDADSILVSRLDAAIRALAPAAMANICVSSQARDLLLALLAVQHRTLLACEHDRDPDSPGSAHSRERTRPSDAGQRWRRCSHLRAPRRLRRQLGFAWQPAPRFVGSGGGKHQTGRQRRARIWPVVVRHVLELKESGHTPFRDGYYGDMALAALIPNATGGLHLYREVDDTPIAWWNPLELVSEVEAWLVPAAGNAMCVNQLISFVSVLGSDDQVRLGLPWVANLVVADPNRIAGGTYALTPWLIEMRSVAVDPGLLTTWQRVVDDLVVAGVTRLAPYSN